jgi:hypothetical protein
MSLQVFDAGPRLVDDESRPHRAPAVAEQRP